VNIALRSSTLKEGSITSTIEHTWAAIKSTRALVKNQNTADSFFFPNYIFQVLVVMGLKPTNFLGFLEFLEFLESSLKLINRSISL
jgi:hypothetical protein